MRSIFSAITLRMGGLLVAIMMATVPAFAGNSATINTSCDVDDQLELSVTIFEGEVAGGVIKTEMDFGTLTSATLGAPLLPAPGKYFTALMTANSSSRAYNVKQTGSAMVAGSNSLPAGALIVTPHNNGASLPGTLGTGGTWVATDKTLYTSEAAGSLATFAAAYAITDNPALGSTEVIPADQPNGNYTGNIVFTLTTA